MAANDIRTVSDPTNVTPPTMDAQNLGTITVKANRNTTKKDAEAGYSTTPADEHSASDPNNIVAKFDNRLDDPRYYQGDAVT